MAFREIPEIRHDKDIKRIVAYYKRAYNQVFKEILRLLDEPDLDGIYLMQEQSLIRQIQLILKQNDEVVLPELDDLIRLAHHEGQAQAIFSLGDATTLSEATKNVSFSMLAKNSVEAIISDTFEDVLALTGRTDKKIKQTVRKVAGEIMRLNAIQQLGYETTRKEIISKLLKEGFSKQIKDDFVGVTDSAGRRWRLDSYVNMLVKTKMQQSYIEGIITESVERGTDLGVISSHGAIDACSNFEGMVISLTGQTEGFYSYQELRRTNKIFHPHCKHTVTPLRDISLLPKQLQEKHEKQLEKVKSGKII
jgi:Phage minor capsid protein 2